MIRLDVWLYGPLARFAGEKSQGSFANLAVEMPDGATMADLLAHLGVPADEKGLTFVNGALTDTPGLGADLGRVLHDGERVGLLHKLSAWPFQYRFGAAMGEELIAAMQSRADGGLYHISARPAE